MRKLVFSAWLALAVLACGRQGEGERCDLDAGTDGPDSDCDDGLVCTAGSELGTAGDICCPAGGNPTSPACIPQTTPGTGGGGTGGDGTGGATTTTTSTGGGGMGGATTTTTTSTGGGGMGGAGGATTSAGGTGGTGGGGGA